MLDGTPADLANSRLQQARECLLSAELEIAANLLKASANRSYYAIFNAMRAVLAFDKFDSKKHSGVISQFRKNYVKTAVFPVEFSKIIDSAFEVRNDSDYQDYYIISKSDAAAQLENARAFLAAVEKYLAPKLQNR